MLSKFYHLQINWGVDHHLLHNIALSGFISTELVLLFLISFEDGMLLSMSVSGTDSCR
ncbi:hypothetical protein SAMN05216325_102173 [Nitrosomonas marina]|uniref:Uncharacterized protein n=1 Tax=Nitrosomonas marina TaxID=917 RepID=A0A1H8B9F1_9PROT|nr:hypothetical protein SAMN05216325_102173 [Nitrosomonas marina]